MTKNSLFILQQQISKFIQSDGTDLSELDNFFILDQQPLSNKDRILIYQNSYKPKMLQSLSEDFPETRKFLTERIFARLAQEYLNSHPSLYWSVAEWSKHFPDFIKGTKLNEQYPFLSDLAQWEWLKVISSNAPISDPFDFTFEIQKINPDKYQSIILKLNPSVNLFRSIWVLHKIEHNKPVLNEETFYVIYEKKREIEYLNIDNNSWKILRMISSGFPIGKIISSLPDLKEQQITTYFSKWVNEKIISSFYLEII